MTDLRTLLHDAAPRPAHAVDIDALTAEAARRRPWRRIGLWLGSIVVVLGVGGGAVIGLAPADDPSEVDTLPAPEVTTTTAPGAADAGAITVVGSDTSPATTLPADVASEDATAETAEPPWYWHEPERESCELQSGGAGVSDEDVGGGAGFDDPNTHTCTFTATEPGGYLAAGTWSLVIERDGERIERGHLDQSPACADVGFIRPGDVVTVSVRSPGGATTADTYINAGAQWSCSS
jgi:hypothetical protein